MCGFTRQPNSPLHCTIVCSHQQHRRAFLSTARPTECCQPSQFLSIRQGSDLSGEQHFSVSSGAAKLVHQGSREGASWGRREEAGGAVPPPPPGILREVCTQASAPPRTAQSALRLASKEEQNWVFSLCLHKKRICIPARTSAHPAC